MLCIVFVSCVRTGIRVSERVGRDLSDQEQEATIPPNDTIAQDLRYLIYQVFFHFLLGIDVIACLVCG